MSHPKTPSWAEMLAVFTRIGLLSFGGPAAQVSLMHRELIEERNWLSEKDYLSALSFCMLLPGPEAMQLATYAGWRLRGWPGGLLAGLMFVIPGALVIAALFVGYVHWGSLPLVDAMFDGIKAAVTVIVLQALMRIAGKAMTKPWQIVLAGLAFAALFLFDAPFPLILICAALVGYAFRTPALASPDPDPAPGWTKTVRTAMVWIAIWVAPLLLALITGQTFLADIGTFFAKLALVTFGGAYAVLAYLAQAAVHDQGWVTTPEVIDALGLAETTPGPLILATQFVAMQAGHHAGDLALAALAALMALWMTFVPCFLWIFAGAPWISRLSQHSGASGALSGITAAVVGVIASLSLWFGMHVWFDDLRRVAFGPIGFDLPVPGSIDLTAVALTALSAVLIVWLKRGLIESLVLVALVAAGLSFI